MVQDYARVLNVRFPTGNPRKICDSDVMLYFLRKEADELDRYDFIGYTDLDMIYGRLADFLPPEPGGYSLISADGRRTCGPFTLMNRRALPVLLDSAEVRARLEQEQYVMLDESVLLMELFAQRGPIFCRADSLQAALTPGFDFRRQYGIWEDGALTVCDSRGRCLASGIFHFSRHKNKRAFRLRAGVSGAQRWGVCRWGSFDLDRRYHRFAFGLFRALNRVRLASVLVWGLP
jgi:hypothetical protein